MTTAAMVLSVYTDETAYLGDRPVRQVLVDRAKAAGLAGLTVFEAIGGIGHSTHVHRRHFLERERPVVVEIVDVERRLRDFAASLADIPHLGLITLQPIEVIAPAAWAPPPAL